MPDLWWWNFGVPAAMAGLFLLKSLGRRYTRLQLWEKAAKAQLRDSDVKIAAFRPRPKLTARSGPLEVRITDARGRDKSVVVEIEGPEGFSELRLRRQLFKPRTREIEIGDEPFDDQFVIEGPALAVGARLDEFMRRRLLSASPGCPSLEIGDGRLRAEVADEDLRRILPMLLSIGQRLAEPVAAERKVADNAIQDRVVGVRRFNLTLLARERPGDPATLEVLREGCLDRSAAVRLQAAIELGEEKRDLVLKLAEKSVHDESAARAVSHLGSTLSFETLQNILARAVKSLSKEKGRLVRTARACVEELGRRGVPAAGVLAQTLAETKGEVAAAAARALGTIGDASAEPPLLQALESEDNDLKEAATTALGRVGTAAAVPVLQEVADGSWLDRSLRKVARQSIAEIQSRLVGAAPGQLSLAGADGETGRLSLATADAGQLALAPEAAGELALLPHGAEGEDERAAPTPRVSTRG